MSNILINFAIGSYADPTTMPPDRAKIIGISRHRDETEYRAARFFHDVIPELAEATAQTLVDNCDKPVIAANAKRLLAQWRKNKQEKDSTTIR